MRRLQPSRGPARRRAGQLDLEAVVPARPGLIERGLDGGPQRIRPCDLNAAQRRLDPLQAPRFWCHAAKRDTPCTDDGAIEIERDRGRHEGELVRARSRTLR